MLFFALIILFGLVTGWLGTQGSKSQTIRLLDIFAIGPSMIALGMLAQNSPLWLRVAVVYFGSTTITFNLRNYLALQTQ
jgi:hypothetical protein